MQKLIEDRKEDINHFFAIAGFPYKFVLKGNGGTVYQTRELATLLSRVKRFNPDEIWYVVDGRQALHFEQTFRAARKADLISDEVVLEHVGFGTMNGKDGKPFKTRDGGVMSLKSLMDLVYQETYKKITNESLVGEEKESVAKTVAMAALKYADLLPYRGTDYIFEVEKFSDLEGKTGPYLLYSTIRMKSLLNKANNIDKEEAKEIKGDNEKDIILTLLALPRILNKSIDTKSLNDIAEYLYVLTSLYNKFYAENKVLVEENKQLENKISKISFAFRLKSLHKASSFFSNLSLLSSFNEKLSSHKTIESNSSFVIP